MRLLKQVHEEVKESDDRFEQSQEKSASEAAAASSSSSAAGETASALPPFYLFEVSRCDLAEFIPSPTRQCLQTTDIGHTAEKVPHASHTLTLS